MQVTKSSSIGPLAGTRCDLDKTNKIIIAHQVLVIPFEDFVISFVGILLVASRAVLPCDLLSLYNKVSIIATAIAIIFQIIKAYQFAGDILCAQYY